MYNAKMLIISLCIFEGVADDSANTDVLAKAAP